MIRLTGTALIGAGLTGAEEDTTGKKQFPIQTGLTPALKDDHLPGKATLLNQWGR